MPDAVEFIQLIKKAAIEAVEATKPVKVCFGKVVQVTPLQIQVEQKLLLEEPNLIQTQRVTTHKVFITGRKVADNSEIGKVEITVQNGLVVGDDVILIRQQGGQNYIVVDKIK